MLRLTTLGATDLRDRRGHPVRDVLAQPKRVALLAYLALEGRRGPVPRDRLLALFWPESDDAHARNALSQALHHLRQTLGGEVIRNLGADALAVPGEALWCDAAAFSDALERGETELALDLYRGEFCPALFVTGSPGVEQWLEEQRTTLRRRAIAGARTQVERLAERGDRDGAARLARRGLGLHPDDEGDVRALIAQLDQAGDGIGALSAYREFAQRLMREFETEPAPETRRLAEAIRQRREPPSAPSGDPLAAPRAPSVEVGPRAPRWSGRRTAIPAAGIVVLVAMLALAGRSRTTAPPPAKALAVFPFTVRGDPGLGYLREGLVDLLSAKLDGATGYRALDPRAVLAAVATGDSTAGPTADLMGRTARRLGARWYISGDVIENGGRVQVNGALYDLTAGPQPVVTVSVTRDTAALFELVDELTGRLLARVSSGRDSALTQLAAVTTHSLPALKAFLDGERALGAGRDAEAAAGFRTATTLDSTFALAQYRLALTAAWTSVAGVEDPTVWAERAARNGRRLTPLVRDLLAAYRAYRTGSPDAEDLYRAITSAHPEHVEAWFMLGETLFHQNPSQGRSPDEARGAFDRVLALDPENAHAMLHLARLAAAKGRYAELDSLTRWYIDRYGATERSLEMRALRASAHADGAAVAAVAREAGAAEIFVATAVLQSALLYARDIGAARAFAAAFARRPPGNLRMVRWLHRSVGDIEVAGARWSVAVTAGPALPVDEEWSLETKALLASEPAFGVPTSWIRTLRDSIAKRRGYHGIPTFDDQHLELGSVMRTSLLGLLSVRLGDSAAVRRSLRELDAVGAGPVEGLAKDLARGLRAEVARSEGDRERALSLLAAFRSDSAAPALRGLAHWGIRERFLRAELLHSLGQDREALPVYASFAGASDAPWMALAELRQGEILARQGERTQAAFHYRRFLGLWSDPDPEFRPLVARARGALATLTTE